MCLSKSDFLSLGVCFDYVERSFVHYEDSHEYEGKEVPWDEPWPMKEALYSFIFFE